HVAVLSLHLFSRSRATPRGWSDIHGSISFLKYSCAISHLIMHTSLGWPICVVFCPVLLAMAFILSNCLLPSSSIIIIYLVRYTHFIYLSLHVLSHLRRSLLYFLAGN